MIQVENLVRPHLLAVKPYSSARDEYTGKEGIFLDANENAFGSASERLLNRYPDPYQKLLKEEISQWRNVATDQIFLGNGSDEPIDLLIRLFCEPSKDAILITAPTYGMYAVSAGIHNVAIQVSELEEGFSLSAEKLLSKVSAATKVIFLCSPNNPSGNALAEKEIRKVVESFNGIVVVDEAYIDFYEGKSWVSEVKAYPNLVVLQTFSKAWGLAALRLGMAFANPITIGFLNKIKPPYNINQLTQEVALKSLQNKEKVSEFVREVLKERDKTQAALTELAYVEKVFPSDANFLLVKMEAPKAVYNYLVENKVIVRDRSSVALCEGCLRITIGTPEENLRLLSLLSDFRN